MLLHPDGPGILVLFKGNRFFFDPNHRGALHLIAFLDVTVVDNGQPAGGIFRPDDPAEVKAGAGGIRGFFGCRWLERPVGLTGRRGFFSRRLGRRFQESTGIFTRRHHPWGHGQGTGSGGGASCGRARPAGLVGRGGQGAAGSWFGRDRLFSYRGALAGGCG